MPDAELMRLEEDARRARNWKRWGPYLPERQWGTVREDYSELGESWESFPHDHARSRAYRWGEDGLLGLTDRECRLCFALALWNGRDPILKERLFGLTGPEGNHGEDVKECYYYLDSTPTHAYMRALYKYPQRAFPYDKLIAENRRRSRDEPEFELTDTGVFGDDRYFDVFVEYAKRAPDDILIRITVANRAAEPAMLHLLPTLWFRNAWSLGRASDQTGESGSAEGECWAQPSITRAGDGALCAQHETLGTYLLHAAALAGERAPASLFTENETNAERLYGVPNRTPFVKDAFDAFVVHGDAGAVNPDGCGTKAAFHYILDVPARGERVVRLRLSSAAEMPAVSFGRGFDAMIAERTDESDAFYARVLPAGATPDERRVMRQAYAGLLWSKQFYHYSVRDWLNGDPAYPPPPPARRGGRNADWKHLYNRDVISVPDKWEYPWYAAWDLSFHMIAMGVIDPDFAKQQMLLLLREWYMHPNGQMPAYEFALGDVNPPVHAWACWRLYKMTGPRGRRDRVFLARAFHKLLINFTWWVNRKDLEGNHLFAGGFLGLDNIGVFDRSQRLPAGGHLEQADGTAWMAFYCATMLSIALELARDDPGYEDVASKFFEHFVAIADAMNTLGGSGLWDEEDGFYYDQLHVRDAHIPLRIRSLVGVIPLFACEILTEREMAHLPGFAKRTNWFLRNRTDLASHISCMATVGESGGAMRLLAIPTRDRLVRVLRHVLDEGELLGRFGVRSMSRAYEREPYIFRNGGAEYRVDYVPGEGNSGLFGGNSNWRGPVWTPLNYLLIEALERYHRFYGDTVTVECPTGSGRWMTLDAVARELSRRLSSLFLTGTGGRPVHGGDARYATDPHWRDLVLFHEYFNAETGRGLGASHQTGWTALIARLIADGARERGESSTGVAVAGAAHVLPAPPAHSRDTAVGA